MRPPDGTPMRVPREWTDADGASSHPGAERVFTVDALRELVQLVDFLGRRASGGSVNA